MPKTHLRLQHSESVVAQSAAQIYSAYIAVGRVSEGSEEEWIARSIDEAVKLVNAADAAVISDDEIESLEGQSLGEAVGRKPTLRSRHD